MRRVIPDIIAFFVTFTCVNEVIKPIPSDAMLQRARTEVQLPGNEL